MEKLLIKNSFFVLHCKRISDGKMQEILCILPCSVQESMNALTGKNLASLSILCSGCNHAVIGVFKNVRNSWESTYSEPCQTSKMEHFAKIVNGYLFLQNTPFYMFGRVLNTLATHYWLDFKSALLCLRQFLKTKAV